MEVHQKIKNKTTCDPAIPILGIYPRKLKTLIQQDTCTPMFIEALLTTVKIWKQPKCSLIEEWIKPWYIYTMKYYLAIKKNKTLSFTTAWM